MPRLVVFRGDSVESEIRLSGGPVRVGRHARNDVVLDDTLNGVSRFHAEIRPEGNSYVIADLNSRNGVWIGGRKIKDKAALLLGVPVTVGAFELVLEDDASGTFDSRVASPRTVVSTAAISDTGASGATGRSSATGSSRTGVGASSGRAPAAARPSAPPMSPATKQTLLWSGVAVAVLVVCGVTYAVVRNRAPKAPIEPPVTQTVAIPTPAPEPPPAPPVDENKIRNDQDLAAAREMIEAKNYAGALSDHLQPLLERDPENADALELKRQANEAIDAAASRPKPKPAVAPPAPEPETPGIARRPNESYADYQARVKQLQAALTDGKNALDKQEYATAIARFRAVDREAPKFQGVDGLLADALAKQKTTVDSAIDGGQQNETAGKLMEARRWYEIALKADPTSTIAREKRAAVMTQMNAAAEKIYAAATYASKSGNASQAKKLFQQVYDTTLPGDEYREKAAKELELLKK